MSKQVYVSGVDGISFVREQMSLRNRLTWRVERSWWYGLFCVRPRNACWVLKPHKIFSSASCGFSRTSMNDCSGPGGQVCRPPASLKC